MPDSAQSSGHPVPRADRHARLGQGTAKSVRPWSDVHAVMRAWETEFGQRAPRLLPVQSPVTVGTLCATRRVPGPSAAKTPHVASWGTVIAWLRFGLVGLLEDRRCVDVRFECARHGQVDGAEPRENLPLRPADIPVRCIQLLHDRWGQAQSRLRIACSIAQVLFEASA